MGLMQLMPATARQYRQANVLRPREPISRPATRHLKDAAARIRAPAGPRRLQRRRGCRQALRRHSAVPRNAGLRGQNILQPAATRLSADRQVRQSNPKAYTTGYFAVGSEPPRGEIIEGIYVAESEARLRHEFEEKGLHVLSLAAKRHCWPAGRSASQAAEDPAPRVSGLQPGTGDAAQGRHAAGAVARYAAASGRRIPVFRGVLDDVHEKVRGGTALSDAFDEHGDLFPRVYTASLMAGERSGNLDAVLRRYVAYEKVDRHRPRARRSPR